MVEQPSNYLEKEDKPKTKNSIGFKAITTFTSNQKACGCGHSSCPTFKRFYEVDLSIIN